MAAGECIGGTGGGMFKVDALFSDQTEPFTNCKRGVQFNTVKFINFGTPEIFAVIYLKSNK